MRYYLSLLFLIILFQLNAQGLIYQKDNTFQSVQKIEMPKQNNATLQKKNVGKAFSALTFAKDIDVSLNCDKNGTWESIQGDKLLWRLKIHSPGATSLNFAFDKYIMPKGGQMIIYTPDHELIAGPFTSYDNNTNGQLWSPIILSDEVVIQVIIPSDAQKEFDLSIWKVNHGFNDRFEKSFSQSCHLDVVCGADEGFPQVDPFRDVIRSVGVYSIQGTRLCTGALINNAKNDCTPYFLTADHCGITRGNESTVVINWNYQNSTCRTPDSAASGGAGDGKFNISNQGVKLRASWPDVDMALVELNDDVPVEADPYFAGWNISAEAPNGAVCIHHPAVDEKRFSLDEDPLKTYSNDPLYWIVDNWEIGSTESGSSGAPLFNNNQEIIGQIFGGEAACGNNLWDIFGKLSESWEGNGTKQTRLRDWLDPDNTGITRLGGRGCSALLKSTESKIGFCNTVSTEESVILSINEGFSGKADLSFESSAQGIMVDFETSTIEFQENIIAKINVDQSVPTGTYNLIIKAQQGITEAITNINLVVSKDSPAEVVRVSPDDRATVGTQFAFEWEDDYDTYDFQLSQNADFRTILLDSVTDENSIEIKNLESESEFYWRIRGSNACGKGVWNDFTFETGKIECFTLSSADLPKDILDANINTVISTISVSRNQTVNQVKVIQVMGSHSWVGDLQFRLESPSGTEIILLNQECENSRNFNMGFDDESTNFINCPLNQNTTMVPQNSLSKFVNELSGGDWKMKVLDLAEQDGGSFESWTIEICVNISKNTVSTEDEIAEVVRIFPNPAQDVLYVEQLESMKDPAFKLYNYIGQEVLSGSIESAVDISSIESGVYFMQVVDNNKSLGLHKIIISK